jgi:hypothetical protein
MSGMPVVTKDLRVRSSTDEHAHTDQRLREHGSSPKESNHVNIMRNHRRFREASYLPVKKVAQIKESAIMALCSKSQTMLGMPVITKYFEARHCKSPRCEAGQADQSVRDHVSSVEESTISRMQVITRDLEASHTRRRSPHRSARQRS